MECPKSGRRWFRFSLRTLFVVVTLVAISFWSAPMLLAKYQEWRQEQAIQQAIRTLRVSVGGQKEIGIGPSETQR